MTIKRKKKKSNTHEPKIPLYFLLSHLSYHISTFSPIKLFSITSHLHSDPKHYNTNTLFLEMTSKEF